MGQGDKVRRGVRVCRDQNAKEKDIADAAQVKGKERNGGAADAWTCTGRGEGLQIGPSSEAGVHGVRRPERQVMECRTQRTGRKESIR